MARIGVLLVVILVSGCELGAGDDLRRFVRNAGKDMAGKVEPVPAVVVAQVPVYSGAQARDPFDLSAMREPIPVKPREQREPLEKVGGYIGQNFGQIRVRL